MVKLNSPLVPSSISFSLPNFPENRINYPWIFGLLLTLGVLFGILCCSIWDQIPTPTTPVIWSSSAQWITPSEPTYRFYARRSFNLEDLDVGGWLRLSADNDFILYVNNLVVARELSYYGQIPRNTLGLASQLSDTHQNLNDSRPYSLRVRDWVQWSYPKDWKLTNYVDLTPYLRPGKNVIALEVQKSQTNPRVLLEGAIYPSDSESPLIDLTTGASPWLISTLAENQDQLRWFDREFNDLNWSEGSILGLPTQTTYSKVSQHLFDRPLLGHWITGTQNERGEVWLNRTWQVPQKRQRAFIRFAGEGDYSLLINDSFVKHDDTGNSGLLHLYEVTNLLNRGSNTLFVRLSSSMATDHNHNIEPVGFYLDGWLETKPDKASSPIFTDGNWITSTKPLNKAQGPIEKERIEPLESAILVREPFLGEFKRQFEGNAAWLNYPTYLWHQILWCLGGILIVLFWAGSLGRFWLNQKDNWWDSWAAGTILLLPGTFFLIGIGLLKHRYGEAELALQFAQSQSNLLILLTFFTLVFFTLLWSLIRVRNINIFSSLLWILIGVIDTEKKQVFRHFLIKFKHLKLSHLTLVSIIIVGFGLRVYRLGFVDLDPDANVSLDCVRGILRTGAPITTSGIWYTRGPFYHYALAFWLRLVGDSDFNAAFFSVILGTATLIVIYFLAKQISGKVWITLLITAVLAIDPWEIWYSRNIRFYQITQFLYILGLWAFLPGFITSRKTFYQYICFISLTLMLLTQEVTITLLPSFAIGALFFYRSFRLTSEWKSVLAVCIMAFFYLYDAIFVIIKCLTPLAGMSSLTTNYIKLYLSGDITFFVTDFFVGFNRMKIIYTFFFVLGIIYFLLKKERIKLFLYTIILIDIILLTVMVFFEGSRYTYPLYPLFVLLSIYSACHLGEKLGEKLNKISANLLPFKFIVMGSILLLLLLNIEPIRVLSSYQDSITARHIQVTEYIKNHKQPGDIVISNVPSVHTTLLGGTDYYIPHRMSFFDAVYWRKGQLVDRWEGGILLTNGDQLSDILAKNQRVWIHLLYLPQLPKNVEIGKFYDLLETLGEPVLETFGTTLRLWNSEDGVLPRLVNQGKDIGTY